MTTSSSNPIIVALADILEDRCSAIPDIELGWNESRSYTLDGMAARALRFIGNGNPPLTLTTASGTSVMADVLFSVSADGNTLTLTVKPNTGPWTANAVFTFVDRLKGTTRTFDPTLKNRGNV